MSISRHYNSIESAEDAETALQYLFTAAGDSTNIAERRVNESFHKRGRGRKMDPELFSYVQTAYDVGEEDREEENALEDMQLKAINSLLERKIQAIETEFEEQNRVTKNMRGLIIDLKSTYALILSRIYSVQDLKNFISPDIDVEPWLSNWSQDHLEVIPLNNYSEKEIYAADKGETKLLKNIKDKISFDRHKILDGLIEYFKGVSRGDIAEFIIVNGFKFISESAAGIKNENELTEEDFHVVNGARVTYISRRKIDLNYALELVNLPATTYKKRSTKIKLELIDLGEEISGGTNNKMHDYLIEE
jgi:hypothetical protein